MEPTAMVYRGWHIERIQENGRRFWVTRNPFEQWSLRQEFGSKGDAMGYVDEAMGKMKKMSPAEDGESYEVRPYGL